MTPDQTVLETVDPNDSLTAPRLIRPTRGLPLIAISGAAGKTSTGWLLIHLLEQAGHEVGAWLSDGVYVDRTLRQDELHAWELAALATRAREIDYLVQEIPAVLAANLPQNSTWMVVLTSICGSDDQCQRDAAAVRAQIGAEAVIGALAAGGRIVANADDMMLVDAASASAHATTYFALNGGNPVLRNHIAAGGDAVWIHGGWIKTQIAGVKRRLIEVSELPATLNGHLIFQVQNTLAAIAVLATLGGPDSDIQPIVASLIEQRAPTMRSGIMIHVDDGRTIIADSPTSLQAIKQLARAVRAFGPKRVIQVLGRLGALSDGEAVEAARVLGSLGGIAVLPAGVEGDGRVENIKAGLIMSDNPPAIVFRNVQETRAAYVRSLLNEGDVALVLDRPI